MIFASHPDKKPVDTGGQGTLTPGLTLADSTPFQSSTDCGISEAVKTGSTPKPERRNFADSIRVEAIKIRLLFSSSDGIFARTILSSESRRRHAHSHRQMITLMESANWLEPPARSMPSSSPSSTGKPLTGPAG
ncbi:hypothetical protein KC329_g24 [Hortaea werneckii]|nr:hypothetical protein KC329_g24 [Hortaea werneckii]